MDGSGARTALTVPPTAWVTGILPRACWKVPDGLPPYMVSMPVNPAPRSPRARDGMCATTRCCILRNMPANPAPRSPRVGRCAVVRCSFPELRPHLAAGIAHFRFTRIPEPSVLVGTAMRSCFRITCKFRRRNRLFYLGIREFFTHRSHPQRDTTNLCSLILPFFRF